MDPMPGGLMLRLSREMSAHECPHAPHEHTLSQTVAGGRQASSEWPAKPSRGGLASGERATQVKEGRSGERPFSIRDFWVLVTQIAFY